MSYVIYNKETTETLLGPGPCVGCYVEFYKSEGAAKGALTRFAKKGKLGSNVVTDPKTFERTETAYVKADFAVADVLDFRNNIEKSVTRTNAMTGEEFEESVNANYSTSPASENYWCS